MTARNQLQRIASLVQTRNAIDQEIAAVTNRPAHSGHIGEFVASRIFDIKLTESATTKGMDGRFPDGPLAGKSVDIKHYSLNQSILDIRPDALPDFYLVSTGPRKPPESSRGTTQPWVIKAIFLFDASEVVERFRERGVKIGTATSVRRHLWDEAEVYPTPNNKQLPLTPEQESMIGWFGGG